MRRELKSPLKDKPLRLPGQSLEEERRKLFEDKLEPWLLMSVIAIVWACFEWWRYVMNVKPNPIVFTGVAVLAVAMGAWRFYRVRPKLRALRQGADGEKAVGQFLERLRATGYEVFHDTSALRSILITP